MENREVFFYSRVLFWGFGLSLILNITGTGFWISELLGAAIGFIILAFKKNNNRPKWLKKISGFIFAFLATIIIANMGGTMYLKNTPNSILSLMPLVVGLILSKCGDSAYKRTVRILFIYTMVLFFFSGGVLVNYVNLENLLPLTFNVKNVLVGAGIFALTSITPVLCLNDFSDKKSLMLNYSLSILTVISLSLLIVTVLGNQEAMLYRYPEFVLLKRIKIYEFFSNVENLFVIMIVTDFVTTIASGLKNVELKGNAKPVVLVGVLCLLANYACSQTEIMTLFYKFFPIILFLLFILTLFPKK